MNPGELNHRITITEDLNRDSHEKDENGFPIENWQTWKPLWSSKRGLSGRVFYAAMAVQSENNVIFKVRYIKGIRPDMRIVDDEGTYEIIGKPVDKDGKRRELYITANEVKAKWVAQLKLKKVINSQFYVILYI